MNAEEKTKDILLIDKPKGITSFDVIRILRKELKIRKMGHAGTLDPLASGLMLIGIGSGTKKLTQLIGLPKKYRAEVLLGTKTDSGDLEGKKIQVSSIGDQFSGEKIKVVLNELIGKQMLPVPAYSAIKQGGTALHKKVRRGESVTVPIREMEIIEAKFISFDEEGKVIVVELAVSSGTYIRSIAEEIGKRLGTVATLKNLRRLSIGEYTVEDARPVV